MESDEIRAQLLEAERAAAAPYVLYPKDPWWQGVLLALTSPLFVLVVTQTAGVFSGHRTWAVLPGIAITLISLFVVLNQRKRRGALPQGKAPRELRVVFRWYYIGAGITVLAVVTLALLTTLWWSLPLSFAVTFGGLLWFGAAYERAAARVRERLA